MADELNSAFARSGSEMAARIQGFDWSTTPLGPIRSWPAALKIAVGMMIHSSFPKCIVWGPQLVTIYNDAFKPILGDKPEALGRSFRDVWHEAWDTIHPIVDRAIKGESTFIEDFPLVIDRFGYPEQCYFTFCYSPIHDETGKVAGMLDTVIETTGKVEAERAAAVRNAELAHRIRNTFSLVSALSAQTLRNSPTLDAAAHILSHRLQALAQTHSLLTSTAKPSAVVAEIVRKAVEPHIVSSDRLHASGPPIKLPERQALSLALAVNELATNALKHGALSTDAGRITVTWSIRRHDNAQRVFHFQWTEEDGPPCIEPAHSSFGTRLLESVIPADFSGEGRLTYAPDGFQYTLIADFERFESHDDT